MSRSDTCLEIFRLNALVAETPFRRSAHHLHIREELPSRRPYSVSPSPPPPPITHLFAFAPASKHSLVSHPVLPISSHRLRALPSCPVALSLSAPFSSPSLSPLSSCRALSIRALPVASLPIALSLSPPFPSRSLSLRSLPVSLSLAPPFPSCSLSPRPSRRPLSHCPLSHCPRSLLRSVPSPSLPSPSLSSSLCPVALSPVAPFLSRHPRSLTLPSLSHVALALSLSYIA
ncbi:unnamed protein product [Closterium sp. NIES-65]|nr:unnamed protein product [Closterium sp. NIES-65]